VSEDDRTYAAVLRIDAKVDDVRQRMSRMEAQGEAQSKSDDAQWKKIEEHSQRIALNKEQIERVSQSNKRLLAIIGTFTAGGGGLLGYLAKVLHLGGAQ